MGAPELEAFLTHLAVTRKVSASTQNQALAALLFLYQKVLDLELPWLTEVVRAKPSRYLPVVLTHKEVRAVLAKLEDEYWLIGSILYGGGLRLQEALQLRVKDVDFDLRQLVIRSGKGGKDRVTILPEGRVIRCSATCRVRAQHTQAMQRGDGGVEAAFALAHRMGLAVRVPGDFRFAGPAQRGVHHVSGHRATPHQAGHPGGRHRQAGHVPHVPPQFRHAPAGAWLRHPHGAGTARPQGRQDDAGVHARHAQGCECACRVRSTGNVRL